MVIYHCQENFFIVENEPEETVGFSILGESITLEGRGGGIIGDLGLNDC